MRGRSAVSTDLDGLYAAQRLTMVRLAVAAGRRPRRRGVGGPAGLPRPRPAARPPRRIPAPRSPSCGAQVVAGVPRGAPRASGRAGSRVGAGHRRRRPAAAPRQREVVVLEVWARLSRPQTAATLRVGERTVAAARTSATRRASPSERAGGRHGDPRARRRGARAAGRRDRRRRPQASVRRRSSTRTPGGQHASVTGGWSPSRRSSPWLSWWPWSPASSTTPARLPRRLQLPLPPRRRPSPTARSPPRRSHLGSGRAAPSRGPRSASAGP